MQPTPTPSPPGGDSTGHTVAVHVKTGVWPSEGAGSTVTLAGRSASTDDHGNAVFSNVVEGRHDLAVSHSLYEPYRRSIEINRDEDETPHTPEIDVRPRLTGRVMAGVLGYLVGPPAVWPRVDPRAGNEALMQYHYPATGDLVFLKHDLAPSVREWFRIEGNQARLLQDYSGGSPVGLGHTNAVWAYDTMRFGELHVFQHTRIEIDQEIRGNETNCKEIRRYAAEHRLTLVDAGRADFGGSIGTADYIRLREDPTAGVGGKGRYTEEFTYAKGWGWVGFRGVHTDDEAIAGTRVFNTIRRDLEPAHQPLPLCPVQ